MPRIDITLGLPSLDRGRRVGVWRNHIQHLLAEGSIDASQSADLCMRAEQEWSKQKMNGHQIKKAVNAARVLADKKGGTLGTKEVETMLKMEREFEERAGHLETEKEQEEKTGTEKEQEKDDLDGFEQVERV